MSFQTKWVVNKSIDQPTYLPGMGLLPSGRPIQLGRRCGHGSHVASVLAHWFCRYSPGEQESKGRGR